MGAVLVDGIMKQKIKSWSSVTLCSLILVCTSVPSQTSNESGNERQVDERSKVSNYVAEVKSIRSLAMDAGPVIRKKHRP